MIQTQLDWLFAGLYSTEFIPRCLDYTLPPPDGASYLKSHAVLLETPPSPLLGLSGTLIRDFRFQTLLQPPSPTMSHNRRTY
ncbi:hypothetical protein Zmor_023757 [Zophobas morio]|uniref:Uncharacterized protein n=1 Tax=Zophobas morio TaxID=2755281 RepID=A0AA38HYZ1_9CUCU|nr:hypothetical protein Zmor_023757 [Zophobas morio]